MQKVPKGAGQVPRPCIVRSVTPTREKTIYLYNINKKKGGRSLCHIKYHNKFFSKKYLAEQALLEEQRKANPVTP